MRSFLCTVAVAAALLGALPAQAQFSNKGMGLSGGWMAFNRTAGLDGGAFIGFDASMYIESGFEVVSLSKVMFPLDPNTGERVVGVAPSLGIRYLILEENIRPYVGADLSYLLIFKQAGTQQFAGVGPNLGLDVFVSDSISLGIRGQFNVYLMLNQPVQTSLTLSAGAAVYF